MVSKKGGILVCLLLLILIVGSYYFIKKCNPTVENERISKWSKIISGRLTSDNNTNYQKVEITIYPTLSSEYKQYVPTTKSHPLTENELEGYNRYLNNIYLAIDGEIIKFEIVSLPIEGFPCKKTTTSFCNNKHIVDILDLNKNQRYKADVVIKGESRLSIDFRTMDAYLAIKNAKENNWKAEYVKLNKW